MADVFFVHLHLSNTSQIVRDIRYEFIFRASQILSLNSVCICKMNENVCSPCYVAIYELIAFLFARILDLTSAVQRYLGILLVVVRTFPVYRSDRCHDAKHLLHAGDVTSV